MFDIKKIYTQFNCIWSVYFVFFLFSFCSLFLFLFFSLFFSFPFMFQKNTDNSFIIINLLHLLEIQHISYIIACVKHVMVLKKKNAN